MVNKNRSVAEYYVLVVNHQEHKLEHETVRYVLFEVNYALIQQAYPHFLPLFTSQLVLYTTLSTFSSGLYTGLFWYSGIFEKKKNSLYRELFKY